MDSGLGARAGSRASRGAAAPSVGSTLTARWAGPMAVLRGTLALPRHFVLSLGGGFGYVTAGVAGHVTAQDGVPRSPTSP